MTQTEALLWTWAIEAPVATALAAAWGLRRGRLVRVALVAIAASLFTHPLLWLADAALRPQLVWWLRMGLLEGLVVVVEGAAYAVGTATGARRGLLLSLAANAASFAAGLLFAP